MRASESSMAVRLLSAARCSPPIAGPRASDRSRSACWYSTSLLSKPRAIQYSTVMHHAAFRSGFHLASGPLASNLTADCDAAVRAARGLWTKDTSTWSSDAEVRQKVANRLGWLESPALMAASLDRIRTFAEGVRRDGFTDVVLLGMGGSSLAPEVLRAVLGARPGWPRL